ncbi:flagellar hook-length control protein FliK [Pseudomonas hygromyciniae]|uniref:Flagellar hook-length control protein FliK n=1 Tax=Pseudomonas hygromyciniae TaxID=2812000 RepID=A0ABX7JYZ5_9PSED|nr:type III secretion system HrpP C-terminal domain-containing protein [Pseudomonas hygromyciniae]MBN0977698.1 flagellar hook-length control protein FliK [Pseudomonas hygromyciniae]QSB40606.1 flagellar hook-length control protein FliK [Pseudomonas hygromyciniae]
MTQVQASKPERPRPREPRADQEPVPSGGVPWEQGRLFTQLLDSDAEGAGYGTSATAAGVAGDTLMIEAMTAQLLPRIHGSAQWPLQAVLYLPRLGRISASVRREQGQWNIELAAEQELATRWLGDVRQRCEERLAEALGAPVALHLTHVGAT